MKLEAFDSRKLRRLRRRLQVPRYEAVGILECLWAYVQVHHPTGAMPADFPADFGDWIGWTDDAEELVDELTYAGFLDECPEHGGWCVHDWADHADRYLRRKLTRRNLTFAHPEGSPTSTHREPPRVPMREPADHPLREPDGSPEGGRAATRQEALPEPEPEPEPEPGKMRRKAALFPEEGLPDDQIQRLHRLAGQNGFTSDQASHATSIVTAWSHAGGHERKDWVSAVLGAMKRGWGLEGFLAPRATHRTYEPPPDEGEKPPLDLTPEEEDKAEAFHEERRKRREARERAASEEDHLSPEERRARQDLLHQQAQELRERQMAESGSNAPPTFPTDVVEAITNWAAGHAKGGNLPELVQNRDWVATQLQGMLDMARTKGVSRDDWVKQAYGRISWAAKEAEPFFFEGGKSPPRPPANHA